MKHLSVLLKSFLVVALLANCSLGMAAKKNDAKLIVGEQRIDNDWLFFLGDESEAKNAAFDDSAWRKLDIPHDWSIEGEYSEKNPTGKGGGYMPSGVAWYRKHITIPKSMQGKKIQIDFTGVMENSEVWINGEYLGMHPYGYTGIIYDLSDKLNYGGDNVISVRTDTSKQPASRWYSGAGIYRHVNLLIDNQIRFANFGVYVSVPEIDLDKKTAVVKIESTVCNDTDKDVAANIAVTLTAPDGKVLSKTLPVTLKAASTSTHTQEINVENTILWDIDDPNLYVAKVDLLLGKKKALDTHQNNVGIRKTEWKAENGFWLNGRNVDIAGVCMHHEGGAVGAAVPSSIWERRLKQIKALGANALRTAHNPMDEPFLDLCDKLGILVMSEAFDVWEVSKNKYDYSRAFTEWCERDMEDMVLRARNHPSVFIYSIGNEMHEDYSKPRSFEIYKTLRDISHKLAPGTPVIMAAVNPNHWGSYENGFQDLGDLVAHNYRDMELIRAHQQKPSRIILGSESHQTPDAWEYVIKYPFLSGIFLWTGWDYLGEAYWPNISSRAGLYTRNGYIKPLGWEHMTWWVSEPMVHISRGAGEGRNMMMYDDWTFSEEEIGKQSTVRIYHNCDEVELFHNGKSLGSEKWHDNFTPAEFVVNNVPGEIKAIGRRNGKVVAEHSYTTANKAVKIEVEAEQPTIRNIWDDVAYFRVTLVDEQGRRYPVGAYNLKFTVEGNGKIVGLDNDYFQNHEKYVADTHSTYLGNAVAIVRSTASEGTIKVTVSCDGLESGSAEITIVE